jgi:predicted nucleic acid-binding protein
LSIYVDASVILRNALAQPGAIHRLGDYEPGIASDLVELECLRTLDRLRLAGAIPEEHLALARRRTLEWIAPLSRVHVDSAVLELAARPHPTALGTLDAIHLATALLWRETMDRDVKMATHDRALGSAARAFGLEVIGLS